MVDVRRADVVLHHSLPAIFRVEQSSALPPRFEVQACVKIWWWFEATELLLPIPNRIVKRRTADDTRKGTVGSCHHILTDVSLPHSEQTCPAPNLFWCGGC